MLCLYFVNGEKDTWFGTSICVRCVIARLCKEKSRIKMQNSLFTPKLLNYLFNEEYNFISTFHLPI